MGSIETKQHVPALRTGQDTLWSTHVVADYVHLFKLS